MSPRLMLRIAGSCFGLGFTGLTLLCPAEAIGTKALDTVQSFFDILLTTMRHGNELGRSGRFIRLQPVVHSIFDVSLMARMAIGSGWATLSPAQQQQVIEAFERYIVAIYADRFDTYSGEQLQVLGEQLSSAGTVVMTRIVDSNGEPENLNFMMRSNGSMWQIADVFLNGTISELAVRPLRVRVHTSKTGRRWADRRAEPKGRPSPQHRYHRLCATMIAELFSSFLP